MKREIELFLVFFKIGSFTLGGGYAMIPLIQDEIVYKKKWMGEETFLDSLAVAQSTPGVLAVNTAIMTGYHISQGFGILMALLGAVLPSFLMILCLSSILIHYQDAKFMQQIFFGVKPATVALIFIAAVKLWKSSKLSKKQILIPLGVATLIGMNFLSPIWILLSSMIIGNFYYAWRDKR